MTTNSEVVTGGHQPARHHPFVQPLLGATIGCLSLALVFTSGYLIGSKDIGAPPSAVAAEIQPPAGAELPPPDAGAPRLVAEPENDRANDKQGPDRDAWKPLKRSITVDKGDNLWKIAASIAPDADRQATVERIVRLNSLKKEAGLEIGQRLVVPVAHEKVRQRPEKQEQEPKKPKADPSPTQRVASPLSVSIPRIELEQNLVELNVIGGALQVPSDYADVGWWRDGPSPGAQGSAVLVGHVDSPTGPAVFYELSSIQVGDMVVIRRADGTKATFRVNDATLYPRESFPSGSVYRTTGRPTLTLITCGGSYDMTAGYYSHNLVVTAHPVRAKRR